jgi:hypothetical protein
MDFVLQETLQYPYCRHCKANTLNVEIAKPVFVMA